jgi:hypothetical protein
MVEDIVKYVKMTLEGHRLGKVRTFMRASTHAPFLRPSSVFFPCDI